MLSPECVQELRSYWLPHLTDGGLHRLIELLERGSPLLIQGAFTRSIPMGCLATHAAWHHPATEHLTAGAGITWMHNVVRLNPATSRVIREWDSAGPHDWQVRAEFLSVFRDEQARRRERVRAWKSESVEEGKYESVTV